MQHICKTSLQVFPNSVAARASKNISQSFTRTCYSCLALRRAQAGPSDNSHHLPFSSAHPAIHYSELSAWEAAAESRHNQGNTGSVFFFKEKKKKLRHEWNETDQCVGWNNTSSPDITCCVSFMFSKLSMYDACKMYSEEHQQQPGLGRKFSFGGTKKVQRSEPQKVSVTTQITFQPWLKNSPWVKLETQHP